MISTTTLVLAALLAGSGQGILLDFYSDSCASCVSMEPTLRRLASEGFDVRRVHVQQQQQLVRRFGITQVPTYVALVDGREVDRVVGPTSYQRLRQMLATGEAPAAQTGSTVLGTHQAAARSTDPAGVTHHPASSAGDPQQRALHASVRLRVEDPTGKSYGTGTIIHSQGDEALVITCGHLFRDSSGQGRIQVDLFAPGARNPVAARLLCYDLQNDVALVTIWPGMPVTPVQVAPENYQIQPGDRVFSIGCDQGADATIRVSQVNSLNRYLGPANIQVAGRPVIGRSGGGLFTADGRLIGICILADPQDDEGIYAALPVIHAHLAANLPRGIFQRDAPMVAVTNPAAAPATPFAINDPPPTMPRQMPSLPQRSDDGSAPAPTPGSVPVPETLVEFLQQGGAGVEVICIVRPKDDPNSPGQLIIIDQPTRELLDFLAAHQRTRTAQPIVLQAGQASGPIATLPDRIGSSTRGPVLRGQAQ